MREYLNKLASNLEETMNEQPASLATDSKYLECSDGSALVNGVHVPAMVISLLRQLGRPLRSYSPGELRDAIVASADGVLIEDTDGASFHDRLTLSEPEKQTRQDKKMPRKSAHEPEKHAEDAIEVPFHSHTQAAERCSQHLALCA